MIRQLVVKNTIRIIKTRPMIMVDMALIGADIAKMITNPEKEVVTGVVIAKKMIPRIDIMTDMITTEDPAQKRKNLIKRSQLQQLLRKKRRNRQERKNRRLHRSLRKKSMSVKLMLDKPVVQIPTTDMIMEDITITEGTNMNVGCIAQAITVDGTMTIVAIKVIVTTINPSQI